MTYQILQKNYAEKVMFYDFLFQRISIGVENFLNACVGMCEITKSNNYRKYFLNRPKLRKMEEKLIPFKILEHN